MRLLIILMILFPGFHKAYAQISYPDTMAGDISILTKYYGDSTVIRWGYTHPQLWYHTLYNTVTVYRRNVTDDGKYEQIAELIPWDSARMETVAASMTTPNMLVVMLENIHRHWDNTLFDGYQSILQKNDNFYNRWMLVHYAADRSPIAATSAAMRWVDTSIKPNKVYAYKVVSHSTGKRAYKVTIPVIKSFQPVIYNVIEGEGGFTLIWEKKLHDYSFSAYNIEISNDGKHYTRLNSAPYVQAFDESLNIKPRYYSYKITAENYKPKYVRIIGLDAFGDMSKPSEPIKAMGRDKTPPTPPILTYDSSMTHLTQVLQWKVENHEEIETFHLERSFGDGTYIHKNWARPEQTRKKDTFLIEGIYKYRLIAVDTAGNKSFSEPIFVKAYDLKPPTKPDKPKASVDSTGRIVLSWLPHAEKDVIGYYVMVADHKDRAFNKLTPHIWRKHFFIDSVNLHMLTAERSYRLIAVDNDYMESEPSEILTIQLPSIDPPSPALIADYKVSDRGIRLALLPSSSGKIDRHELQRKSQDSVWTTIAVFTSRFSSYLDTMVTSGQSYTYRLIAIGLNGKQSKSVKDITLQAMKTPHPAPLLSDTIVANTVMLTWPPEEQVYQVRIYRKSQDSGYQLIGYRNGLETSYSEILRKKSVDYHYRIQKIYAGGGKSAFSNEVVVNME